MFVLYEDEDGWFDGTITWYNTQLGKLRVVFEDDSDDYILPEDINRVDVFLKKCFARSIFNAIRKFLFVISDIAHTFFNENQIISCDP